jgi:flagella basal body P-ring formation protein FlgA
MKAEMMKKGGMPMKMKDGKKVPIFMNKGGMAASSMGKVKTAAPSKDGVAVKGKTKGKMITMAKGGKAMKSGGKAC